MGNAAGFHISEAQALALALERLRRASSAILNALAHLDSNIDHAVCELEAAYASSAQDTHSHLYWAQDVLDGKVRLKVRKRPGRKAETFDSIRQRAAAQNIIVHFVHRFEGTEYAVYRGQVKVAHARTEQRCAEVLRALMVSRKTKKRA